MDNRKKTALCAVLVALALLVVVGQWVAAQHTQSSRRSWDDLIARAHGGGRQHGLHGTGAPPPQKMAELFDAVLERLEVTAAQRAQFQPQRRQFELRLAEISQDRSLSGQEQHGQTMQAWFTMLNAMSPGLSPEQRDVLQRLQAMIRKRMAARQRSGR